MNRRRRASAIALAGLTMVLITCQHAAAEPVVKMQATGFLLDNDVLVLNGKASHLGRFGGFAELDFIPGEIDGTFEAIGVAVLFAANGDLLVGVFRWLVEDEGQGLIAFSWRDSVELSDGMIVRSTGRFVANRPRGTAAQTNKLLLDNPEKRRLLNLLNEFREWCEATFDDLDTYTCRDGEALILGLIEVSEISR